MCRQARCRPLFSAGLHLFDLVPIDLQYVGIAIVAATSNGRLERIGIRITISRRAIAEFVFAFRFKDPLFQGITGQAARPRTVVIGDDHKIPRKTQQVADVEFFAGARSLHRAFLRVIAVIGLILPLLATDLPAYVIAKLGRTGSAQITGLTDGAQQRPGDELGRLTRWADFSVKLTGSDGSIYDLRLDPENRFPLTPTTFTLFFVGDRFNVRYLSMSPQRFVVITDDSSPWAVRERCYHLAKEIELIRADPNHYDTPSAAGVNGYS